MTRQVIIVLTLPKPGGPVAGPSCAAAPPEAPPIPARMCKRRFRADCFDKCSDKHPHYACLWGNPSDEVADEIIKEADLEGNNMIDFEEFKKQVRVTAMFRPCVGDTKAVCAPWKQPVEGPWTGWP